jgi:hypothetical protein
LTIEFFCHIISLASESKCRTPRITSCWSPLMTGNEPRNSTTPCARGVCYKLRSADLVLCIFFVSGQCTHNLCFYDIFASCFPLFRAPERLCLCVNWSPYQIKTCRKKGFKLILPQRFNEPPEPLIRWRPSHLVLNKRYHF